MTGLGNIENNHLLLEEEKLCLGLQEVVASSSASRSHHRRPPHRNPNFSLVSQLCDSFGGYVCSKKLTG